MTAYSNGLNINLLDINLKGCPSLPQWVGSITASELLEDGDEIYLSNYGIRVYVQNSVRVQNFYKYQVIDRTGFPTQPVVGQNTIYPAGIYYSNILHDLMDQDIQFANRMAVQSYSAIVLPQGFKKAQLVNGLFEELNFKISSNETDLTYILQERSYIPINQVNTYVLEQFSNELSCNHFTISSNTGQNVYVFDVEDINYNGTIFNEPITTYLLYSREDLIKLGKKYLERSMGLRESITFDLRDDEIIDLSTHLDSCWVVNSKLARINSIDVLLGKLTIRGYYVNEANYASN